MLDRRRPQERDVEARKYLEMRIDRARRPEFPSAGTGSVRVGSTEGLRGAQGYIP